MRSTDTLTISLPAELAAEVDRLARQEGRTRSELFREAFRQYAERRRRWDQIFAYGEARASAGHLTDEQLASAVKRRRRSRHSAPR
ncbi:MAG TPA: ribbon-helix-helix protein, CopG family [Candidatus Dormibacteraeota bacterium]|nr:ribbon-helix-helix protein, CopG family [Candidatus Dormibacteraeota bacterium]